MNRMDRTLFKKITEYFKKLWFKNMIEITDINFDEMKIQYYWITEGFANPDAEVFIKDGKIYAGIIDEYDEDELEEVYMSCKTFEEFKKAYEETFQDEDWKKYNK